MKIFTVNKRHLNKALQKYISYQYVCVYGCVCVYTCGCLKRPGKGMGSLEAGDTGGSVLPGVVAGTKLCSSTRRASFLNQWSFSYSKEKFLTEKKIEGKILSSKFSLGTKDGIPIKHFKLALNMLNVSAPPFLLRSLTCLLYFYEGRKRCCKRVLPASQFDKRNRIEISDVHWAFINDDR